MFLWVWKELVYKFFVDYTSIVDFPCVQFADILRITKNRDRSSWFYQSNENKYFSSSQERLMCIEIMKLCKNWLKRNKITFWPPQRIDMGYIKVCLLKFKTFMPIPNYLYRIVNAAASLCYLMHLKMQQKYNEKRKKVIFFRKCNSLQSFVLRDLLLSSNIRYSILNFLWFQSLPNQYYC